MASKLPLPLLRIQYEKSAEEYLRSLPPEHFMESVPQAIQRLIFLVAFELIRARRPDVQPFNELLIQYEHGRPPRRRQVVPDNMVVIHPEPIKAKGSYDVPLQPARPFWVLEYVSKSSERKDYEESYEKYERELKVPYYLVFSPDNQEMTLYKLGSKGYRSVKPNGQGRCAIPGLEVEMGLVDGWVRFWFRGEMLPLPSEMQRQLDEERRARLEAEQELARLRQQVAELQQRGKA
jgi:Uma2 family endonuclease